MALAAWRLFQFGVDVADDFDKLLIVAPIFQSLREGGWNGPDLEYAIRGIVAVRRHGGVACGDGAGMPQRPDLRAMELTHQSPVATLDLCLLCCCATETKLVPLSLSSVNFAGSVVTLHRSSHPCSLL